MSDRKRGYMWHFYLMAMLALASLIVVNFLGMRHRARLDLTADQRFTLSDGTERIFEKLPGNVTVTYFVDEEPPSKRINLERDVTDKLEELAASSNGKLVVKVERIKNSEASDKREELKERGIEPAVDVKKTGDSNSDRAQIRGFEGFFSSIEVRHGAAKPEVINGIFNVVDDDDLLHEHRVETLEFDISFALLKMRNQTVKAPLPTMLRTLDDKITFQFFHSVQMPSNNPQLAETIDKALSELKADVGDKMVIQTDTIPFGRQWVMPDRRLAPWGVETDKTVDPATVGSDNVKEGPKFFYATVLVEYHGTPTVIWEFKDETTVEAIHTKLEDAVWELVKPRTRLGLIGKGAPTQMNRGNPYGPVMSYIQSSLGYDVVNVELGPGKTIPKDLACLIVFEANLLSERELYEIDRYLAEGGNVTMFVQGWHANMQVMSPMVKSVNLRKNESMPVFEKWCESIGVTIKQDLLLRMNGQMAPYIADQRRGLMHLPTSVKLAPVVQSGDTNSDSSLARGIDGMPLPLPVAASVDPSKIESLNLDKQDILYLSGDVFKFRPDNKTFPTISLSKPIRTDASWVEMDPNSDPSKDITYQLVDAKPLIAFRLSGEFPTYWDKEKTIPAWTLDPQQQPGREPPEDPLAGKVPPDVKSQKGSLVVCTTAGALNIDYLYAYENEFAQNTAIPRGIAFIRNIAEANIYGDDLVNLRARTGSAPHIEGTVTDRDKVIWYLLCLAGMPALLVGAAAARTAIQNQKRKEYEDSLKS